MNELSLYIKNYFGITNEQAEIIRGLFKPQHLSKGEFHTASGSYHSNLSFVKSGYLRVFENKDEKEITQWLTSPNEFIVDLGTLVFDTPARRHIQAITDCELYTISRDDYRNIHQQMPSWPEFEKRLISKCFTVLEDRVFNFISMTAEERYQQLFYYNSDIFNRVPLQYLASMLGMSAETLSRIRKKSIS